MDDKQFRNWTKSSRSSSNDNCVEIATAPDGVVGVRDSKDPDGGILIFSPHSWQTFIDGVRDGEFDA